MYTEKLINDLKLDSEQTADTIFADQEQIIELIKAIKELHERIEELEKYKQSKEHHTAKPGSAYDLSLAPKKTFDLMD